MAKKKKAPDASTEQGAGQVRVPAKKVSGSVKKAQANIPKKVLDTSGKVKGAAKKVPKGKSDPQKSETPAAGAGGEGANTTPPPVTSPAGPDPARQALERYVRITGFPLSFIDDIMKARQDGILDDNSTIEDYIGVAVDNKDFQGRFPSIVNQWRKREAGDVGVQIMTPAQVLEYEQTLKNAADDYGMSSWVSSPEQVANLLNNDVSADEAVERINQAGYAASVAPPAFREAFFKQYGLTEGNLIGFFLDPNKEEGEIKKAVAQGQIVAAGIQNGFANNWEVGRRLFDRGVSESDAMSGFARAALGRGLESGLGASVSENDLVDAAFGDAAAGQRVASVSAQRSGRFNTSGGAAESNKGVTGLSGATAT